MLGLPFSPISILQLSILVVYLVIFLFIYALFEYMYVEFIRDNKQTVVKIIQFVVMLSISYYLLFLLFSIFIDEMITRIFVIFAYFHIIPILSIIGYEDNISSNIIIVLVFTTLISFIPINLGGFNGQNVKYFNYNDGLEYEYIYFGISDGLYQFIDGNTIILFPTDSGYIKYNK